MPQFIEGDLSTPLEGLKYSPVPMKTPTINTYDPLGRITKSVLADGSSTENFYSITTDGLFKTTVKDFEGRYTSQYADSDGKTVLIEQTNGSIVRTKYEYNLLGEIIAVTDNRGNRTKITYDGLGRRTAIRNPDMGLVEFKYNSMGLLSEKIDDNLRHRIHGIRYEYQKGRMEKINYPDRPDTVFEYGDDSTSRNAGRLVRVTGESGSEEYFYGRMGEIEKTVKTIHSLKLNTPDFVYTTESSFNYLGQIERMVYPDGEVLEYSYDRGGNIRKVTGSHRGVTTDYVKEIGYDEFGQRNYIRYGNDTETTYTYEPVRRWLTRIVTESASGSQMGTDRKIQNMEYKFDRMGNIQSIVNTPASRKITQVFEYDNLYQLTKATATYEDNTYSSAKYKNVYTQTYNYDTIGNMTSKTSLQNDNRGDVMESLNYSLNYKYNPSRPHQATEIGDMAYYYDFNGNLTGKGKATGINGDPNGEGYEQGAIISQDHYVAEDGMSGWDSGAITQTTPDDEKIAETDRSERYVWNEDNQMVKSTVNGQDCYYSYDTSGQRVVKKGIFGETVYVNMFFEIKDNDMITKFIFVGESRIVSKLGHKYDDLNGGEYERLNTYYHHTDHLNTSNVITDYQGNIFKEVYLTAYGEEWVNRGNDINRKLGVDYTGKYKDEETGLNFFGARYYDSMTSRWISADPILNNYLPSGNKEKDKNLPGMGGVYNPVNMQLYHYGANNPIKYIDPTGEWVESALDIAFIASDVAGIAIDAGKGDAGGVVINSVALVVDVVCLIIPIAAGGGLAVKGIGNGIKWLLKGGSKADDILKIANTGLKYGRGATNLQDAARLIRSGEQITSRTIKKSLRAQARNIMEQAGMDIAGKEVHHIIPLEYAHKFGPDFNPNTLENLVGLTKGNHDVISGMWEQFRRKFGNSATPEQIKKMVNETIKVINNM
jgi:RHS repeat-associated protein